jgi:predicted RNA-binding protein with PIN domain
VSGERRRPDGSRRGARYWIDGYNVLLRSKLGAGDSLESRRDELVARVAATGREAWIVFDSREQHAGLRRSTPRRITVVFAPPGRSADDVLVEKVRRAPDLDGVVVVSDDRELAQRVGFLGARTQSVAEFVRALKPAASSTPAKERPLTRAEVDDWLKFFGQPPRKESE